jgi:hypothetical protein
MGIGCLQFLAQSEDLRDMIITRGYGDKVNIANRPICPSKQNGNISLPTERLCWMNIWVWDGEVWDLGFEL